MRRNEEGGDLVYVAVRHYWRVDARGEPGRLPGDLGKALSCEPEPHAGQAVVEATDTPT